MALALKINIVEQNTRKFLEFDSTILVSDACQIVRENTTEAILGLPKDYGLFMGGEDVTGVWLESGRKLSYYMLQKHDVLEYRPKVRTLKVCMLDGEVKTHIVDDTQPVSELMAVICKKIGIMNHEEYSLASEVEEEEEEEETIDRRHSGIFTLIKRKDDEKESDMKKPRNDDEITWVDHGKTLREQGIDESEVLMFRRKYFITNQNIDQRNPVQLNHLYLQCRDAVLDGTHPITVKNSTKLAGIQCQIQFGDNLDQNSKAGFLRQKEFLPREYINNKGIEKKIWEEHKKYGGKSGIGSKGELDAKVDYVTLARSLKTYGVTFFLVKEKMKGKYKFVPRLLGVTKDYVLKVDKKTKEILKTWPLFTVRRWSTSTNTFTLDFGEYSDQLYSVKTTESDQISQLIKDYIDIIMKQQRALENEGSKGDDGAVLEEDNISPNMVSFTEHHRGISNPQQIDIMSIAKPAVMRPGVQGAVPFTHHSVQMNQNAVVTNQVHSANQPISTNIPSTTTVTLSQPQQALLNTIEFGKTTITNCIDDLDTEPELSELGTDPSSVKWKQVVLASHKHTVTSQIAAMNAATAEMVTLVSYVNKEVDSTAVNAAIHTIATNLPVMTKDLKMIAVLLEGDMDEITLLEAVKNLYSAFSDILIIAEPEKTESHESLIDTASMLCEASNAVLCIIDEPQDFESQNIILELTKVIQNAADRLILNGKDVAFCCTNQEQQNIDFNSASTISLTEAVANTITDLMQKAKAVDSPCEDQELHNIFINSAKACTSATSQLIACTNVVAPTVDNPACKKQLIKAAEEVGCVVEEMIQVCKKASQDELQLKDFLSVSEEITKALNNLQNHIKPAGAGEEIDHMSIYDEAVETILVSSEKVFALQGNASEMFCQTSILAPATSNIIKNIKIESENQADLELQNRLIEAAEQLTEATDNMNESAKQCISNPDDTDKQTVLCDAIKYVRAASDVATNNALKKKTIKYLENAAQNAVATFIQCMGATQGAGSYTSAPQTQEDLISGCKAVADIVPHLVEGFKGTIDKPDSTQSHLLLINACDQFHTAGTKMLSYVETSLPTIIDQASSVQLNTSSNQYHKALVELSSALSQAKEASGLLKTKTDLDSIKSFIEELKDLQTATKEETLCPLTSKTTEEVILQLNNSTEAVKSNMENLLTSASQGNEYFTGLASKNTTLALKEFCSAVHSALATSNDHNLFNQLFDAARNVMDLSFSFIEEASLIVEGPQTNASQQKMAQVFKDVSHALDKTVNYVSGKKDVDDVIMNITESTSELNEGKFPDSLHSYGELQEELSRAATGLNEVTSEVVASSLKSIIQLATPSKKFYTALEYLIGIVIEISASTKDQQVQINIAINLKSISMISSDLIVSAKAVASEPNATNVKDQLDNAARAMTDSINSMINACAPAVPGQIECDATMQVIQSMMPLLDNPSESITDASYFECLDTVINQSNILTVSLTKISNHLKKGENEQIGVSVKKVSDFILEIVKSAAQTAYLVGISHPTSVAGQPEVFDQEQLSRAYQVIVSTCRTLTNPNSNQQQVEISEFIIKNHTTILCNICRDASAVTSDPETKKHLDQSALGIVNATAELVKEIKTLDQDLSEESHERCSSVTQPLLTALEGLYTFVNAQEFAPVTTNISEKAWEAKEPITSAGKSFINNSCSMIEAVKSLAQSPKDETMWQTFESKTMGVSHIIEQLVSTIRDSTPGQKECSEAIDKLNQHISDIDTASLTVQDLKLPKQQGNSLQGFNGQVGKAGEAILINIDLVHSAAKNNTEMPGQSVTRILSNFDSMVKASIGVALIMMNSEQQTVLLDQTRRVVECALLLMNEVKKAGGNPKALHTHTDVDDVIRRLKEALQELLTTSNNYSTEVGSVFEAVESITKAMTNMDEVDHSTGHDNGLDDYQTQMAASAKEIAQLAQDMAGKSPEDVSQLSQFCASISQDYISLSEYSSGAIHNSTDPEMADKIKSSILELGQSCIELTKSSRVYQVDPCDAIPKKDLAELAQHVEEKVSHVLTALQANSCGTLSCINAASAVSEILGDLETTIMFATSGTLNAENEDENFSNHRNHILQTTKALIEHAKTLEGVATSSQEQLVVAAQTIVTSIVQLSEEVKTGASSLGSTNPELQVMLLNAVKDVAMALGSLINAAKDASGKSTNDSAMITLKESVKVMVTKVTFLVKTVNTVEDENTRGTHALEATIEAIAQEISLGNTKHSFSENIGLRDELDVDKHNLNSDSVLKLQHLKTTESNKDHHNKATPAELIRVTKPITVAVDAAVDAGNSLKQDDVIIAANMGRKAITEMISTCKAAVFYAETYEIQIKVLTSGNNVGIQYHGLLQKLLCLLDAPSQEGRMALATASGNIKQCITDLVSDANTLTCEPEDSADNPIVITESELHGAAQSIEVATKKLMALKPRTAPSKEVGRSTNFDEIILDACKLIPSAASDLVKAASCVQKELVESGRVKPRPTTRSEDGQWSEGLISAAKLVATATHSLCEAANALVNGSASEEKLISAAKQVAASTAQLLMACTVKADPKSNATKRLQVAGKAVKKATDNLVRAAQKTINNEEEIRIEVNSKLVGGIAQEMDAKYKVMDKERELNKAREHLSLIRKAKYGAGGKKSGTKDTDGSNSGAGFSISGMEHEIDARTKVLKIERELIEAIELLSAIRKARYGERGYESRFGGTNGNNSITESPKKGKWYDYNFKSTPAYKVNVTDDL